MNKKTLTIVVVLLSISLAFGALTRYRSIALENSTINSTTIGATTPSSVVATTSKTNTSVLQGGGHKHQRFSTGCTTGASAGSACTDTLTWTTPFVDANYTVICMGAGVTPAQGGLTLATVAAATVQVETYTVTSTAIHYSTIECIADHD